MSLAIDTDHVTHVLLTDGWHPVAAASFDIDSYEYLHWSDRRCKTDDDPLIVHGGGNSGVCSAGFSFRTPDGDYLAGPLTGILAVRHDYRPCNCPRCTDLEETAA